MKREIFRLVRAQGDQDTDQVYKILCSLCAYLLQLPKPALDRQCAELAASDFFGGEPNPTSLKLAEFFANWDPSYNNVLSVLQLITVQNENSFGYVNSVNSKLVKLESEVVRKLRQIILNKQKLLDKNSPLEPFLRIGGSNEQINLDLTVNQSELNTVQRQTLEHATYTYSKLSDIELQGRLDLDATGQHQPRPTDEGNGLLSRTNQQSQQISMRFDNTSAFNERGS